MKKHSVFLTGILSLVLVFGLALTACDTGSSDLPVSTIEWELDGDGFTQFYTNDSQYYGYSFWSLDDNKGSTTYEIECKKLSGSQYYAYGMIFGADNSASDKFYCVQITASGSYRVWMRNGSIRQALKSWESSDKLHTGHDTINRIKVTTSGTTYTVYLNDSQVCTVTDSSITGTRIGFFVSIGDATEESFPNSPVDARFRQK